jgi:hypothetical protein
MERGRTIAIWLVRLTGLGMFFFGGINLLFMSMFSWTEYPPSWFIYPSVLTVVGLSLIVLSRQLVTRLWNPAHEA